jgi:rhomboid protease GluP
MCIAFLLGVPGGTTDPENLVGLGALVLPSELTQGGIAWRIVTAGFLHLGPTHLLMNCLGLWVLGRQVEQIFNGFVLLGIFLGSSVGSFGFAAAFVQAATSDPRIFLGASAGVLGLVGAIGSFLATGYLLHRRQALGRRLLLVAAVVLAQLLFDYFTPIVSSMLHMTGFVIGVVVAVPWSLATWRRLGRSRG